MSRYPISAIDPKHYVVVGWDSPMASFFAEVIDQTLEAAIDRGEISEDDADPLILWIGATLGEIPTLEQLQRAIASFATIPNDIVEQLQSDYDQPWSPSPMQQSMRRFVAAKVTTEPDTSQDLKPLQTQLLGKSVWVISDLLKGRWNPDGKRSEAIILDVNYCVNPKYQLVMIDSNDFEKPEPFTVDSQGILWDTTD
jgi:hypothetical protein